MPATVATAPSQLWARNQPIEKLRPSESRHRFTSDDAMATPKSRGGDPTGERVDLTHRRRAAPVTPPPASMLARHGNAVSTPRALRAQGERPLVRLVGELRSPARRGQRARLPGRRLRRRRQLLRQRRGLLRRAIGDDHGRGDRASSAGRGTRYVISSKFFWGIEDSVNTRNTLNRKYLLQAVDGSLRRLGLDFLDLIFCHRADPETPIEETVRVMHEIITSGARCTGGRPNGVPRRSPRRGTSPSATTCTSR